MNKKIPVFIVANGETCSESCPFLEYGVCTIFNETLDFEDTENGILHSRCHHCHMMEFLSEKK